MISLEQIKRRPGEGGFEEVQCRDAMRTKGQGIK
jgi:hypothetical protein